MQLTARTQWLMISSVLDFLTISAMLFHLLVFVGTDRQVVHERRRHDAAEADHRKGLEHRVPEDDALGDMRLVRIAVDLRRFLEREDRPEAPQVRLAVDLGVSCLFRRLDELVAAAVLERARGADLGAGRLEPFGDPVEAEMALLDLVVLVVPGHVEGTARYAEPAPDALVPVEGPAQPCAGSRARPGLFGWLSLPAGARS